MENRKRFHHWNTTIPETNLKGGTFDTRRQGEGDRQE